MKRRRLAFVFGLLGAALYLQNASFRAPIPLGSARVIAHRGVHQNFSRVDLEYDTCTAARSVAPLSGFIENTIPSMRAAFHAGADVVEIDLALTKDGKFAVFHDWTLDCRTNGAGDIREYDMAALQLLDVGFGYTLDGGETFPMRGKGIGLMPSLPQVFEALPEGQFLINFKTTDPKEGQIFAKLLAKNPQWRDQVWGVYGDAGPVDATVASVPGLRHFTQTGAKACIKEYAMIGWTGNLPDPCHDTAVLLPFNIAPLLWGWPNMFLHRQKRAGSEVILTGAFSPGIPGHGINMPADLALVTETFNGYIWTDAIEIIGPLMDD